MADQSKKVTLKARDGNIFEIDQDVAKKFGILKAMMEEEGYAESLIPLPNVLSPTLAKVIEYCQKHHEIRTRADQPTGNRSADEKAFDNDFVNGLDINELKELLDAANYLDFREFFDFICKTIADRIKNKSVEYIRKFFREENDYTPAEENALRKKYAWTFEGVDDD